MKQHRCGAPTRTDGVGATVVGAAWGLITWQALTRAEGLSSAAALCALGAAFALLASAGCCYVQWHIGHSDDVSWLVTLVAGFSIQQVSWFVQLLDAPPGAAARSPWAVAFEVVVVATLGTLLAIGRRTPTRRDPLVSGLVLGLAIIVARVGVVSLGLPDSPAAATAAATLAVVGALALLVVVGRRRAVGMDRFRVLGTDLRRLGVAAGVLVVAGQGAAMASGAPDWVLVASMGCSFAGGALALGLAAAAARFAVLDETAAVRVLRRRLEAAETDLHSDQARLHEIRATLAGISCAADLVSRAGLGSVRRDQLQTMIVAELQRLHRLVGSSPDGDPAPVDLDSTLHPVVLRHRTDGLPVRWEPSGQQAIARSDDVAEIVNVLLSNVRRHAGRSPVRLTVETVAHRVEIAVQDAGPGVPATVRPRLFAWGARGPDSPGEGIGLAAAQLLAAGLDGQLRLAPAPPGVRSGATFVLSLPAVETAVETAVLQNGRP